jgi:chromosome partitioning protein
MLPGGLQATLEGLEAKGCSLVVVDTPPALSDSIRQTLAHASLVVVPVQPSPNDLRAVGATVELVRRTRKPLVFVLNRTRAGTRLTADAAVSLSQHGVIAPAFIQDRQDFRVAMIDGRTAQELEPKGKSAGEIGLLWTYIAERLNHGRETEAWS